MSNLLKEAIADAKAVRATALANAKAALEEAFQPKLEAMLAEKLKNEIAEETVSEDLSETNISEENEAVEITDEELNEILAELEGDLDEANQADPNVPAPVAAPVAPAPVDPNAAVAPVPAPVDPNAAVAPAPAPVDPNAAVAPAPAPVAPVAEETESDEEVVDLQELLDSLNEEEVTEGEEEEEIDETIVNEEKEEEEEKVDEKIEDKSVDESLQNQLNEAMAAVQYLRDQLNEVNLLNAKLLYTNKLFNQFNLDQKQKLKVVETFDLAKSIREVKLSYTILSESYSLGGSVVKKTNTTAKTITEGLASKPVASTAPAKEVIVENSNVMASRFQKLAGIKR
jgi:DNA polymerase III delta prime subunit